MVAKQEISIFWFRRDLRLHDNTALYNALNSQYPVLPIFIFDEAILNELPKDEARVNFMHLTLSKINAELFENKASLYIKKGKDYVTNNNIKNIDFLKIDTEGYELNVIQGFEDFLENSPAN